MRTTISLQVLVTLAGHALIQVSSMLAVVRLYQPHMEVQAEEAVDDAFRPSIPSTTKFLFGMCMRVNIAACNYQGWPFMQSIKDFSVFKHTLLVSYVFMAMLVFEVMPPEVSDLLELAPAPTDAFKYELAGYMLANTLGAIGWEAAMRSLFA
jgi:hypothetical protein